jgi:phage/plasmid primase-like uncharacterized protein
MKVGNIEAIFGQAFEIGVEKSPEDQVRFAMMEDDLYPKDILFDGKIHRFSTDPKIKNDAGWYIFFDGEIPAGKYGNFKTGLDATWSYHSHSRVLSPIDHIRIKENIEKAKKLREDEKAKKNEVAAITASSIWEKSGFANENHEYLQRKKIKPHCLRVSGDGRLIAPVYDFNYEITSLQFISGDGSKQYLSGGKVKGCFCVLGELKNRIYIVEGFATGATVFENTGEMTIIAYSAGNLVDATALFRSKLDTVEIIIVADNDKSGTGKNYADQAASKYGARVVMPEKEGMDANDYWLSGGDLNTLLLPPKKSEWLISIDDFCQKPQPIKWLIKNWLQEESLMMIHGASGSGKTFCVLDMILHITSGFSLWNGHKIKQAPAVYLAGEGHNGIRQRIIAWKQKNKPDNKISLWVSKSGRDLDDISGLIKTIEDIRCLPEKPKIIIVDTLHRFMQGDENSSQDSGLMIRACAKLQQEFNCSVLLVHHTGVSEEAQHRARGSSAWRGALDIEINVKNVDGNITVSQKKNKDAELSKDLFFELQKIELANYLDEDNEPVSSAVIVGVTNHIEKPKEIKDDKMSKYRKIFENAWNDRSNEFNTEGNAILNAITLKQYLVDKCDIAENTARRYVTANGGHIIEYLINNNQVTMHNKLITVSNIEWNNKLVLIKKNL